MKPTTIAVDLAKNVFQVAVSHHPGKVAETHRLTALFAVSVRSIGRVGRTTDSSRYLYAAPPL